MKRKGRKHNKQRTCGGKRRYRDHGEAVQALRRLNEKSTRDRVPVRAYECPICKGWHSTSQEKPRWQSL